MAVQFDFEFQGIDELTERLAMMASRLKNPRPVLQVIAGLLEEHVEATFRSQGRKVGRPWRGLSPRTIEARRRRWGHYRQSPVGASASRPVLQWTRRLSKSFRKGHGEHIRRIGQSKLSWGSRVPYGKFLTKRRVILGFRDDAQRRQILFMPFLLWIQGVSPGQIRFRLLSQVSEFRR